MTYEELGALSDEQLVHQELRLEHNLMGHQLRHRLGKLENTSLLRSTRRDIARVQTAITARERASGISKGGLRSKHASSFVAGPTAAATEAGTGFLQGLLDKGEVAE